jgi:hypothetical protein
MIRQMNLLSMINGKVVPTKAFVRGLILVGPVDISFIADRWTRMPVP